MAVGIFAGLPVTNYGAAVEWYQRLLGAEATFYPNDVERAGGSWLRTATCTSSKTPSALVAHSA
jgi:hypothetical protein